MSGIFRVIESPQNASAKEWLSLVESRGIKKNGRFLLGGRKTVPEAISQYPERLEAVLTIDPAQIDGWNIPAHIDRYRLSRALFDALDVSGTGFPLLIGRVPDMPIADLAQVPRGLELICALGDPNNLGAVLRSAAAFGVSRVILLEGAAHPFHPKCLRAAANAQFRLELLRGPTWDMLNKIAGEIVALDGAGESMDAYRWPDHLRLVLGEEGQGLPASLKLRRLAIPMTKSVESLNATVAASLALHAYFTRAR
jgi:TrmH family RNA methyltransferase